MAKKPTNLRVGLGTAVLILALATATPLSAADYPLLLPDNIYCLHARSIQLTEIWEVQIISYTEIRYDYQTFYGEISGSFYACRCFNSG